MSGNKNIFVYSKSCSTSKLCRIQWTLQRNFLTCYSCSYYSSIVKHWGRRKYISQIQICCTTLIDKFLSVASSGFFRPVSLVYDTFYEDLSHPHLLPAAKPGFQTKCPVTLSVTIEAATRGALWKKVLLEISQNLQENTCARVSFLIKLQAWGLQFY